MAWKFPKNPFRNRVEMLDPTPVSLGVNLKTPPSLEETVRRALRQELAKRQEAKVIPDDPLDFDTPEIDEFGDSPHELVDDPSGFEVTRAEKAYLDAQRDQAANILKVKKAAAIERKKQAALSKKDAPLPPEKMDPQ